MSSGGRDKSVKIWDYRNGEFKLRFSLEEHNSFVNSGCFFNRNGTILHYSGDAGGNLIILDVFEQAVIKYHVGAHSDNICSLHATSSFVISSSWDGYMVIIILVC